MLLRFFLQKDCILIHAEDDIKDLKKVEEEVTFAKDEKLRYLTAS